MRHDGGPDLVHTVAWRWTEGDVSKTQVWDYISRVEDRLNLSSKGVESSNNDFQISDMSGWGFRHDNDWHGDLCSFQTGSVGNTSSFLLPTGGALSRLDGSYCLLSAPRGLRPALRGELNYFLLTFISKKGECWVLPSPPSFLSEIGLHLD